MNGDELPVVINAIVIITTLLQALNYYLFGRMRKQNRPMSDGHALLFLTVLGCFALTEGYIAVITGLWGYWGYVALNLYGAWQLRYREKQLDEKGRYDY